MGDKFLTTLIDIINDLDEAKINYCHWKSNKNLDRSLSGLTDLDLLVERTQINLFKEIIFRHNVKYLSSARDHNFPAIENYLGMDADTGKLFHLHVHYKLILGEQFVKNYHLPIESWLMEESEKSEGNVVIPSPERELIILMIRSLLKYRDRDVIKDILGIKSPGMPLEIRNELNYLLGHTSRSNVITALDQISPVISSTLVNDYLDLIESNTRDGRRYLRLRQLLRKELRPYQRQGRWKASWEYFGKLLRSENNRYDKTPGNKKLSSGGISIAFIGADGAGKSTIIKEVTRWLSWKLAVTNFYMGSQEPSDLTDFCQSFARISKKFVSLQVRITGKNTKLHRWIQAFSAFAENLYHLATARDRYHRYTLAGKNVKDGGIVVFDRYPLQEIHELMDEQAMDGPRISDNIAGDSRISSRLAKLEENYYKKILPPDVIFALEVDPETSMMRKPDHDIEVIRSKSQVIKNFNKDSLQVIEVDANLPLSDVLLSIKQAAWQFL